MLKSYSLHSPEFTIKLEITFLLSAISFFAGSESGSIIPDPDTSGSRSTTLLNADLAQVRVDRSRVQRSLNVEEEEVQPPNTNITRLAG